MSGHLEILAPGPLTLVQDQGRPGWASIGVGCAGAADRAALDLANRLVANPPDAAGLEVLFGGLTVRAHGDLLVAVTGAPAPAAIDGRPVGHQRVVRLDSGQQLQLSTPAVGLRSYLAVRGGIDTPAVLGSRSRDTLAALGPEPLRAGDLLPLGPTPSTTPTVDHAPAATRSVWPSNGLVTVRGIPGPRQTWVTGLDRLFGATWSVSSQSDRVGIRLEGPRLGRARWATGRELPTEGAVRGAIQVPPDGQPVIFGPDHPLTGGYPVAAVIVTDDLDATAQLRPGQPVRFRLATGPNLPSSGLG